MILRGQKHLYGVFPVGAVLLMAVLTFASSTFAEGRKNILILNSYNQGYKWTDDETRGAVETLAPLKNQLKLHIEYMDAKWVNDERYFEQLEGILQHKFRNIPLDLIISTDDDALGFLVRYRDDMFGRVPVVFCGVNFFSDDDLKGQPRYTGINETADFKTTLDLALRLHPRTRRVVFISDLTTAAKRVREEFVRVVPLFQDRVHFEFLQDLTMPELLDVVARLPDDSLILNSFFSRDKMGMTFEYDESMMMIAQRAKVPIYATWDFDLGHGIIGGMLTSAYDQGRLAGLIALRILGGEHIENIPVLRECPTRYMFDYDQMERFGIKVSDLPPESVIINEPVSFYAVNKRLLWSAVAGFMGLVLIVLMLLVNTYQRRKAENALRRAHDELEARVQQRTVKLVDEIAERRQVADALRASEQKLHSFIQGFSIPAFVIDRDHLILYWNRALEELSGLRAVEMVGTDSQWRAFYPEKRPCMADLLVDERMELVPGWYGGSSRKSQLLDEAYESTAFFPALGSGGRWLRFTAAAIRDGQGEMVGAIETLEDITDSKKSEEALRQVLLDLQELDFIVNKSPAIAFLWRAAPGWPVAFVSENVAQFGYSPDDLTSGRIPYSSLVYAEDQERVTAEVEEYTRAGLSEFSQEYRIVTKADEVRWIDDHTWIRRDDEGRPTHYQGIVFDITDHKEAEERLRAAHRQLLDIIEFLPDATYVVDRDRKVIAWNRAMEELSGVSKKDIIDRGVDLVMTACYGEAKPNLLDLLFTESEKIEALYDHVERRGKAICTELYMPLVYGGRGACIFTIASPLYDSEGNLVGAIQSARDITNQKLAEEELKESRQRLSDIIDFLPDATMVIDEEGKVIAWNRAIEEMTGVKAADMLGRGDYEYALPFYGERRPILIDLVLKSDEQLEAEYTDVERMGSVLAGEAYMPAMNGGKMYLRGAATVLHDSKGRIVGAIESIRDITSRREVEAALRQAEEKYRGIFEHAPMGIYQTSPQGHIISANPALADFLRYDSPEELMSVITDLSRQLYVDPSRRAELLRLLEERGVVREFEAQFHRKDGSIAWVSLSLRAVRDGSGKVLYLEGTAQDLTTRKLLEARLIQTQKIEAIGTLAGGIAHDFNNLLAAIIGYSEMAKRKFPQDELQRYLDQVLNASNRARDLVAQILVFSRRAEKEVKPIAVGSLIQEALKLLRATLPTTIEIRSQMSADMDVILADPTQIYQIVMNLCTNAAHAMRERGGLLDVALSNEEIDPKMQPCYPELNPGRYVKLTVRDTGVGISPNIISRIFDPFFTTKKREEGTGLGLSVVYGIVKDCGGAITVQSEIGIGSTFIVHLPAVSRESETLPAQLETFAGGSERVLFVDDQAILVDMGREMLEGFGYEVVAATSSAEALAIFRAQPERIDLVITDMTMPGMTGKDLAKELLKIRPDLPVILCSGFSELITEEEARRIGIREFLLKPLSFKTFAEVVRKVLDSSQH